MLNSIVDCYGAAQVVGGIVWFRVNFRHYFHPILNPGFGDHCFIANETWYVHDNSHFHMHGSMKAFATFRLYKL